jgi:hypothetical protein
VFFSWVCMFRFFCSFFAIRSVSLIRRSFSKGGAFSYFPVNSTQWTVPFSAVFLFLLSAVASAKVGRSRIFQWTVLSEQCRSPLCFSLSFLLNHNFPLHHQLSSSYFHEVHSSLFV